MNETQAVGLLNKLLAAGGPIAALLAHKFGWDDTTTGLVMTIVLSIAISATGVIYGHIRGSDANIALAAKDITGVTTIMKVDPKQASPALVKLAEDPAVSQIVVDQTKT